MSSETEDTRTSGWRDEHTFAISHEGGVGNERCRLALVLGRTLRTRASYDAWLAIQEDVGDDVDATEVGDVELQFVLTADDMDELAAALKVMAAQERLRRANKR